MAETKYIIFKLGDRNYGTELERINGIEQSYVIVPVPAGARYVKGLIHLRGEVIPVIDIKERLQLPNESSDESQILVGETHGIRIAIEVDAVTNIVALEEGDVKKVPNVVRSEDTDYLANVIKVNVDGKNEIILSISIDSILSDEEFEDVSAVIENQK